MVRSDDAAGQEQRAGQGGVKMYSLESIMIRCVNLV
jgi:hypothetical protein